MPIYLKDPAAQIDYAIDWGARYLDGRRIHTSDWHITPDEPGGVTLIHASQLPSQTAAILSGGIPGKIYRISNQVELTDGERDERTLTLRVEDR